MKHPAASLVQGQLESTWALRVSPLGTLTFQAKKICRRSGRLGIYVLDSQCASLSMHLCWMRNFRRTLNLKALKAWKALKLLETVRSLSTLAQQRPPSQDFRCRAHGSTSCAVRAVGGRLPVALLQLQQLQQLQLWGLPQPGEPNGRNPPRRLHRQHAGHGDLPGVACGVEGIAWASTQWCHAASGVEPNLLVLGSLADLHPLGAVLQLLLQLSTGRIRSLFEHKCFSAVYASADCTDRRWQFDFKRKCWRAACTKAFLTTSFWAVRFLKANAVRSPVRCVRLLGQDRLRRWDSFRPEMFVAQICWVVAAYAAAASQCGKVCSVLPWKALWKSTTSTCRWDAWIGRWRVRRCFWVHRERQRWQLQQPSACTG